MNWTPERIDMLRAMHTEGLSFSQIAAQIGGITRNAAIGKAGRLGLPKREEGKSSMRTPRPKPKHRPVKREAWKPSIKLAEPPPAPEPIPDMPDDQIPVMQRRTLDQLTNETCRWPVGHPGQPDFFFCGHESADLNIGIPYCAHHGRIASAGPGRAPPSYPHWGSAQPRKSGRARA